MEALKELLQNTYFENTIGQYLVFFGCVIAGIVLGKIFYYISKGFLRRLSAKSKTKFDDYLIDIIEEPIVLLIVTCGVYAGSLVLTLDETALKIFDNIVFVMIAMSITWFFIRLLDMLIRIYLEPMIEKSESKLDDQILPIVRKSLRAVIFILAFIIVLSNLGYDVLSVLAGLGIGGLAFALAAQDSVKNILGGVTIFWDKPFQIGEFVEIKGKLGTVSEVGLRTTRVKSVGGTTIVIPNAHVADALIENFSIRTKRRITMTLGLTYESTADQMEQALVTIRETIAAVKGTEQETIETRFVNFGAFSLDLDVVYWITDMQNWKMIIHNVNMGLKRNLDRDGIDMAFPTETHYVVNQK
jgi:MscS family membrane protein